MPELGVSPKPLKLLTKFDIVDYVGDISSRMQEIQSDRPSGGGGASQQTGEVRITGGAILLDHRVGTLIGRRRRLSLGFNL